MVYGRVSQSGVRERLAVRHSTVGGLRQALRIDRTMTGRHLATTYLC